MWHVVLDARNIEFVTKPFTDLPSLKKATTSILSAFGILRALLDEKNSVTFEEWTTHLPGMMNEFDKEYEIIYFENIFNLVKEKNIIRPFVDWEPVFSPQATIQHPLEYTIPLYFSLLGFKDPDYMMPFSASLPFFSLFSEIYGEANFEDFTNFINKYNTKLCGLTFLHALTLVEMTPKDEEAEDATLLKETLEAFTNFQQVDAKMSLSYVTTSIFFYA